FFHRLRRHARVKPIGLVPFFVKERLRAQYGMMRENAPAEDDRIRSRETVFANLDGFRCLPAGVEIDAVGEQLRTEPADGGESADSHPRGAIDQMPAADAGMPLDDQFGLPLGLMREVPAWPARKTGDPVQLADDGVRAEMKQIDIFAERQVTDPRPFLHHQPARKNPGETDAARRMDRIAELIFQERAAEFPRQEERENSEQSLHAATPRER